MTTALPTKVFPDLLSRALWRSPDRTQRQSLLGAWDVGEHLLPTLQRQPLGTGRHSLGSHARDATTATGVVSASDPLSVDKCLGCALASLVLTEVYDSVLFSGLCRNLWAPSPRTDYHCFAKTTSLSIWSPNTKRASRPQQFSKQHCLHLLEVKKQLLKAHWWQNI